jgi:signal peptidase I
VRALRRSALVELVVTLAVAALLAFAVQAYAVKPYRIPSGSMEPTLAVGERVLVNRASERLGSTPSVGDIVVFHPPAGADALPSRCGVTVPQGSPCPRSTAGRSDQTFIKRVVALGGDTVSVRGGLAVRNGRTQPAPFATPCGDGQACDLPMAIRVPRGQVFLMGDNRGNSDDSRFWGPVPESWVIGGAFGAYWPPKRIGALGSQAP